MALVSETFGATEIILAEKVLGTGFGVVDDKAAFIGVPFIIIRVDQNATTKSEKGFFFSLHVVTKDGRKAIINDGGTGIASQLEMLYQKHPEMMGKPMMVAKGLRVSRYTHPTAGDSETFYLDTSSVS